MSIDAVIFQTFRKLGVDDADSAKFADEINSTIDRRYELHSKQLATRGDVEAVRADVERVRADVERARADLTRAIAESQRWTITAVGLIVAAVAAIQKLL
jgi:multidrug resistance efflux pump